MSRFGFGDCLYAALLVSVSWATLGCSETFASQETVKTPSLLALGDAKPIGQTKLVSDAGLPVRVDYYNVKADLRTVANRFAVELTKKAGWKQTTSADMAVFSSLGAAGSVKWQRIAIFKGKMDSALKHVPNSEKEWAKVIVYRVYKS